jgi:zinc transporter
VTDRNGVVFACAFDGRGGAREGGFEVLEDRAAPFAWVHLDLDGEGARAWLGRSAGLDPVVAEALCAEETRPRAVAFAEGRLVVLRGVNLNPGADPEDMVALRLWIDARRAISVRRRRLVAVQDVREGLARGAGPRSAGEFLVALADRLVARMAGAIAELEDAVDALEDEVLTGESHQLRPRIAGLRRQAIALRRHLAPQREALQRLQAEPPPWLDPRGQIRLREVMDRTTRYVEDLDAAREHAAVTQEELGSRLSEQTNRRMYALSVIAGVFLPLGLLTGLLGINVGGIPGADDPLAFAEVCGLLAVLVVLQVLLYRRLGWF